MSKRSLEQILALVSAAQKNFLTRNPRADLLETFACSPKIHGCSHTAMFYVPGGRQITQVQEGVGRVHTATFYVLRVGHITQVHEGVVRRYTKSRLNVITERRSSSEGV